MLQVTGLAIASVLMSAVFAQDARNAAVPGPARKFSAFSWTHMSHIPEARNRWNRQDLTDMVVIAPWTSLDEAALRLNALPSGKRWVMMFLITDNLANNPVDYCVRREYRMETTYVRQPAMPVLRSGKRVSAVQKWQMVPIQRRIASDQLTSTRGVWMDRGIVETRARVLAIMTGLKSRGVDLNGVIVDNETNLHVSHFIQAPGSFDAIQSDPRWPALASSLGLPVQLPIISWGSDLYFKWTQVMSGRFDQAMNAGVYEPIRSIYPQAQCSNYCSGAIRPGSAWPDLHGHLDVRETRGFGTHDSEEFYGWTTPNRTNKTMGAKLCSEPWRAFRAEVMKVRGMFASSSRPKHAWIGASSWPGETWGKVSLYGSDYWDETVIQLGMHGINTFLLYSPYLPGSTADVTSQRVSLVDSDQDRMQMILGELNQFAGACSDIRVKSPAVGLNDRVIIGGRTDGTQIVWRISFERSVDSATLRFADGSTLTVQPDQGRLGTWLTLSAARLPVAVTVDDGSRGE